MGLLDIIVNGVKDRENFEGNQMDQLDHFVFSHINSVVIVTFGLVGAIWMGINNLLAARFFLLLSPIFMM